MSQGSTEDGGVPYRYGDAGAYRLSERVRDLERSCGAREAARVSHEVRLAALESNFTKHLDRAAVDADRAAESAKKALDEMRLLRDDITAIKAQKGSVSVTLMVQVATILGLFGSFVFALAKMI